jgi:crotonobetainyl-CoA:carnitine CoA-transferase CaiB-like acyl-CoA transferase
MAAAPQGGPAEELVGGTAPATDGGPQDAPLAGVRVVELSMYVQGPTTGLTLQSLGADVVKIEQVGRADILRGYGSLFGVPLDERGQAWLYASLNRGKRSVALDVTSPAGAEVFARLVRASDVVVTNLREDALVGLGADWPTLSALNPRLVYGRGGGFGLRGPLAQDPCQDTVGMAYAGFMDLSSPSATPNYPPGALSDVLTGTAVAAAVLAGLVKRSVTGRGSLVGSSQLQTLMWMELLPVGLAATIGAQMARFAVDAPTNPLFTVYETAEGWVAIAAIHDAQWPPIARVLGLAALLDDERFATFEGVIAHRAELHPILAERFRQRSARQWWQDLRAAGVWTSPVNRVPDLVDDPHVAANEYLVTFPDGFRGPPSPFDVDDWRGARSVAAAYGEHTDTVLAELGYTPDEVLDLRVAGAIF